MKLKELIKNIDCLEINADLNLEIDSICYDSRKATKNSLFVAVSGFETDGHKFIGSAVDKGACAVICEKKPDTETQYILVNNSRDVLAAVSCAFFGYPSSKMKMIGITGTSGKTTTTQLIKHIIETITGEKVGLIGTNGNYIADKEIHTEHTTPESLELQQLFAEMVHEGCKYAVMEVSSHALTLCRVGGILFDVAAFTNLSQDHLDFHKDMNDYALAKKKLFSMCNAACVNIDDDYAHIMTDGIKCPLMTTSLNSDEFSDFSAVSPVITDKDVRFKLKTKHNSKLYDVYLSIPGKFSIYNALTAISVCYALGFELCEIISALSTSKGVKGRMELVNTGTDFSVIIDYSHKPDALEKVLKTLHGSVKGKLIVLFGCGGDRDKLKRPIMGKIAVDNADFTIITSDNPRTENPEDIINDILEGIKNTDRPYKVIVDRTEAIRWAVDNANAGDVILLAGKGHEDYQVIGHNRIHMDEREIVSDILKERNL